MKTAALLAALMLLVTLADCASLISTKPSPSQQSQVQYVHEKDDTIKSDHVSEEEQHDPYRILNELKTDRIHPLLNAWNPYHQQEPIPHNKFLPLIGYPQPIFIPYPFFISPEMLYQFSGQNDIEDSMSRASNNRRTPSYRNSPIYYVRLPPTPYMFIPGLGYTSQPGTFTPSFSPLPYSPYSPIPLSPIFNLPVNFLANGKPTGIYQMGSPNDLPGQMQTFAPQRPPLPPSYRPTYLPQPTYLPTAETKMTTLKRPFVFNGRPEEIYILPNSFNPMTQMYPDALSSYY